MNTKLFAGSSWLALSAFTIGGCAANPDLASQGALKVETANSSLLTLGRPRVWQEGDTLHVTGDVRRPDFSPMFRAGHVHVQFVNAADENIRSATAIYSIPPGRKTPRTPGPRSASYHAQLPGPLPDDGTVRVAVCSKSHPAPQAQE